MQKYLTRTDLGQYKLEYSIICISYHSNIGNHKLPKKEKWSKEASFMLINYFLSNRAGEKNLPVHQGSNKYIEHKIWSQSMASNLEQGLWKSQWKHGNAEHASEAVSTLTFLQGEGIESCHH